MVLVLEDTGDLLALRKRAGQGLSRLLNAVDGLLGQGSIVLLLITNKALGTPHQPYRPWGRCVSQVEFLPLTAEAKTWLKA